jgi:hypothetical protein
MSESIAVSLCSSLVNLCTRVCHGLVIGLYCSCYTVDDIHLLICDYRYAVRLKAVCCSEIVLAAGTDSSSVASFLLGH